MSALRSATIEMERELQKRKERGRLGMLALSTSELEALVDLAARAGGAEWRPIESAPKDGTEILIHHGSYGLPHIAWWLKEGYAFNYRNGPCWISGSANNRPIDEPTHWQPLPSPPHPDLDRETTS